MEGLIARAEPHDHRDVDLHSRRDGRCMHKPLILGVVEVFAVVAGVEHRSRYVFVLRHCSDAVKYVILGQYGIVVCIDHQRAVDRFCLKRTVGGEAAHGCRIAVAIVEVGTVGVYHNELTVGASGYTVTYVGEQVDVGQRMTGDLVGYITGGVGFGAEKFHVAVVGFLSSDDCGGISCLLECRYDALGLISAFAYGTESILPVDKIAGPGNKYVTYAKKYVYNDTIIVYFDMLIF